VNADRAVEDAQGTFAQHVRDLEPDVVIDMISFTMASAQQIVECLRGRVQHFLHCGTIWAMGHSVEVPATEEAPRHPFGEYGIQKSAIQDYLLDQARRSGFPATVLQPGHIVGPGWIPINPAGNLDPQVFTRLARGEEVALPNLGMETLHHVHADDVAQAFMQALANRSLSVGEAFHVVSPAALTLRGYAESVARWFDHTANLKFLPWEEWRKTVSDEHAAPTWDHIAHSPNASIAKAQRLLDYRPRYTSLQAIYESLEWLIGQGIINV
jgi:nucleoside-diphosphate-sugar epimerase